MKQGYLIKGLNELAETLDKMGKPAPEVLLNQIERRIITSFLTSGQKPTPEMMEDKFQRECNRYGSPIMFYRDMAAQHAELLVNRAVTELTTATAAVSAIQVEEFEPNLTRLRSTSPAAKSMISNMADIIRKTRAALADAGSGTSTVSMQAVKLFQKIIVSDDVVKFASVLADAMDAQHEINHQPARKVSI